MENNRLDPKEALKNKAFAKNKPNAESFGNFKVNLARLIDLIDEKQDENFHKNLFSDFLKNYLAVVAELNIWKVPKQNRNE